MASRKTGYVLTGFLLAMIGFFLSLAAFSTPYWMSPFNKEDGIIEINNLGLWQYCFRGYTASRPGNQDMDILGKRYIGCKWVFHREVLSIISELCPTWFRITQAAISIDLLGAGFVTLMSVLFLCLNMCDSYPSRREGKFYLIFGIVSSIAGYVCAAGVLVFGYYSDSSEWAIKEPLYYRLSWSYMFAVFSGAFNIFGGMFLLLAWMQVKTMLKASKPNYKPTLELATLTPTMKY